MTRRSYVKRPANSPNEGRTKEMRNVKESDESSMSSGPVTNASGPSSTVTPTSTPQSFAAAVSTGLTLTTTSVTTPTSVITTTTNSQQHSLYPDRSVFKTAPPSGALRDEIVVGIDTVDGEQYFGTITVREAVREIFVGVMNFEKEVLASVSIGYNKGRIVTFKLVKEFDIDQLESVENFSFFRQGQRKDGTLFEQEIGCKIRGIHRRVQPTGYTENPTRWVKIEGCEYRIEKEELKDWLNHLGNVVSEITEDRVNLEDESDSDEEIEGGFTVGTGIYSVKMRLSSSLPQFVPMCGKRIRLYYRDIPKICTQCFGNHPRKGCTAEKVPWVKYVSDFMLRYDYIPTESYGKWAKIVAQWRDSPENEAQFPKEASQPDLLDEGAQSDPLQSQRPQQGDLADSQVPLPSQQENKAAPKHVDEALVKLRALGINASPITRSKSPSTSNQDAIRVEEESGSGDLHNTDNDHNINTDRTANAKAKQTVKPTKQKK